MNKWDDEKLTYFKNLEWKHKNLTWTSAKKAFIIVFTPEQEKEMLLMCLKNRVQLPGELLIKYTTEVELYVHS